MTKSAESRPNLFRKIAKQCNVSPASVTFALQDSKRISDERKYQVYLAARRLEYRRSKVRGHNHLQFAVFHGQLFPVLTTGSSQLQIWYGVTQAVNRIQATLNIYEVKLFDLCAPRVRVQLE